MATEIRMMCECMMPLNPDNTLDEEGFVICPIHKVRRYGWRDANGRDHSLDGASDLDIEQWQLFGVAIPSRAGNFHAPDAPNLREIVIEPRSYEFDYEGSYGPPSMQARIDRDEAALQARVRLDLRDKRNVPVHDPLGIRTSRPGPEWAEREMDRLTAKDNGGFRP